MSRLLCVDPGLANIGAVVVRLDNQSIEEMHHFSTEKIDRCVRWRCSDDKARRVDECARFYADIIRRLSIKRCAAELPIGGAPNSSAATDLAHAGSCLVSVLAVFNVLPEWYTPREVKAAAAGSPTAKKKQVMAAMEREYPQVLNFFPTIERREHVCDALGVWRAARNGNLARL